MEQVETLAPLRVMLLCCNALVPALLQAHLAQTLWWQPADGDIRYGELTLHALVLTPVEAACTDSAVFADPAKSLSGLQLEPVWLTGQQHEWSIPAAAMARIEQLASQCDWLVFVEPLLLAGSASTSRCQHLNSLAMLQLLVAEQLQAALIDRHSLQSGTRVPVFIQCCLDNQGGLHNQGGLDKRALDWPDFYQQLDINSRWQSFISCRWLLSYPPANAQLCADYCAAQLYLLLLAGLSSDIGPWLDELCPRYLQAASLESAGHLPKPYWFDYQVLVGQILQTNTELTSLTNRIMQYPVPSASAYNAYVRFTEIAAQQGSVLERGAVFDKGAELETAAGLEKAAILSCLPSSHHVFSRIQLCLKRLPAQLPISNLLLLQSKRARPQWQLRGYWRLRFV